MRRLVLALALLLLAPSLRAQSAVGAPFKPVVGLSGESAAPTTTITLGQSIAPLYGPWKFHTGDNPQWADPSFDDSQWETVDLTPKQGRLDPIAGTSGYIPGWTAQGHPGYCCWAWYRIRVRVSTAEPEMLAILGPTDMDDAYQVFADGNLLGGFGKFPAGKETPVPYFAQPRMFPLPAVTGPVLPSTHTLAFRVWMTPGTLYAIPDAGGFHDAPLVGQSGIVAARYRLDWLQHVQIYAASALLASVFLLLVILSLGMFLLDRSDSVYLWAAGVLFLMAVNAASRCLGAWTEILTIPASNWLLVILFYPLLTAGWSMVWWTWFGLRRPVWVPRLLLILTIVSLSFLVIDGGVTHAGVPHSLIASINVTLDIIFAAFALTMVGITLLGIRRLGWEGWLVLPAVVLFNISWFQNRLAVLHFRVAWFPLGIRFSFDIIADLLLAAAVLALLLRRFLLSLRRQREMALDVKQAQEVQQVLIPAKLPQIPGLSIESEYRPALEVGGDFFQIIPHPSDGSVLLVTGDVTGHGLQAGMLVALIVGAIRNQGSHSDDPLVMLQNLNQRLLGRGAAHATALALRIAADGACTLANAGHLPPYLNGKELPMPGALPLGMMEAAEFSLMHFELAPGDTLTLLSDGVAEAMNEDGQLFGFDRIHALLARHLTAAEIAATAQNFGQQDDISVLRVERAA